jgi:hypothetical protein
MAKNYSRRDFVRKAAYVAPVILTLKVKPAYARTGSAGPNPGGHGKPRKRHHGHNRHHHHIFRWIRRVCGW